MKKFQIQTGEINGIYNGKSIETAFRNAIRRNPKKELAILTRFRQIFSTQKGKFYYQETKSLLAQ